MTAHFGFSDLHSFKDYVTYVQTYLPNRFPPDDPADGDDVLTLDSAFEGLRLGLRMAAEEKGERPAFTKGKALVEDAYAAYREGREDDGFRKLEELDKLLSTIRTQ